MELPKNPSSIYEAEQPLLFDYLVRMTGNLQSSTTQLLEVIRICHEQGAKRQQSQEEIRTRLYRTARNIFHDQWDIPSDSILKVIYQGTNQGDALMEAEKALYTLTPIEREILLLRHRYGFTLEEIAKIIGTPTRQVESSLKKIEEDFLNMTKSIQLKFLMQLPLVEIVGEDYNTAPLSELFDEENDQKLRLPVVAIVIAVLVPIVVVILFFAF